MDFGVFLLFYNITHYTALFQHASDATIWNNLLTIVEADLLVDLVRDKFFDGSNALWFKQSNFCVGDGTACRAIHRVASFQTTWDSLIFPVGQANIHRYTV